ncbi:MAG: DUF3488 and transglutaminase-like domain-containing protein [Burkholderiaceae bacterium]|nr:DUF3488 and transglutaminase-like domain-containing protein [Burkholderiaceae bacterium]MDO9090763.1 DUF3488 and transglutaminase-like domain-containing protein [Burkholderiaceae bacterium]
MLSRLDALPREARDTLFLLLVIAWVILPQVGHLPLWCSLLAGAVLLWRGALAVGARPLPGRAWLLGLLTLTVAATWLTHRTLLGRDAGVTLIVVLLTLKTLELRARRDAFVVFFLGFFTMLTNFFFSQSLLTAAAMLIALGGLLTALVNAHLPVGRPPLAQAARMAARMTLIGAPIMAALFVLFPRLSPLWGIPSDAMTGRSGLSAQMQVGRIASLALDDSIAMRIQFKGAPPPQQALYFRGPVLSSFDGREWRAPLSTFAPGIQAGVELLLIGPALEYEVTLEPSNRPWIFVLDATGVAPDTPGFETMMTPELQWLSNRPVTDILRYRAQSHPDFRHGPRSPVPSLQRYLMLPPDSNPRTVALATAMRRDPGLAGASPSALANAVLERLRSGGYIYTLEPGTYGQHTADEFWFDRKEGFCEHIASSFVILMRALGVPSRVVTGYQGGERNPVDGYWTVRQSDAHAWAEIWQSGAGWLRVDPTSAVSPGRVGGLQRLQPPRGVLDTALVTLSPDMAARLRAGWEALNNGWNQWVLNYTQSRQLNLLKNIGFASPSWEDLSYVLIGLLVLASLIGAAWTLWERSQHDPWLRLLERARRRLRKAGFDIPAASPPRQIAAMLQARQALASEGRRTCAEGTPSGSVEEWLLRLEAQRYARSTDSTLSELKREFKQLAWPK